MSLRVIHLRCFYAQVGSEIQCCTAIEPVLGSGDRNLVLCNDVRRDSRCHNILSISGNIPLTYVCDNLLRRSPSVISKGLSLRFEVNSTRPQRAHTMFLTWCAHNGFARRARCAGCTLMGTRGALSGLVY